MNKNSDINKKINIQNNNNQNIQNAFLIIISELNSKDLIIRELESQVNYLESKLEYLQNNIQKKNYENNIYNNNNQMNNIQKPIINESIYNKNYNKMEYENNEFYGNLNGPSNYSTPSRAGTGVKLEVKKFLEEVKSKVNSNIFKKFAEKIKLLLDKKGNHNKDIIINDIKNLFGYEYYDLYEKFKKITGKGE
jgi:hypothetical protein